ncbi:hypothetical protein KM043_005258 [Ampulex compressa]|nr:hypothetical protein KM043_005258 [Ampulex compressa]
MRTFKMLPVLPGDPDGSSTGRRLSLGVCLKHGSSQIPDRRSYRGIAGNPIPSICPISLRNRDDLTLSARDEDGDRDNGAFSSPAPTVLGVLQKFRNRSGDRRVS